MPIIADQPCQSGLKYLIYIGIFMASCLMSGCQSVAPATGLADEVDFVAEGKLAVRDGAESHSGNFRWQQSGDGYRVEVWGPLGQGRTQFSGNAQDMRVLQGQKLLARGRPEDIMAAHVGWSIPVDLLPGWLRGDGVRDDLADIEVDGWWVSFSAFQGEGDRRSPRRIRATRGDRRIVVSIRQLIQ